MCGRLWRLVIIIRCNDRLLLVRRPLAALWGSFSSTTEAARVPLTKESTLFFCEREEHCCVAVPGYQGFLSGLLYEGMFPRDISARQAWLQSLTSPFVGQPVASMLKMCGFQTILWRVHSETEACPVVIQVMELPSTMSTSVLDFEVKRARDMTTERLFKPVRHIMMRVSIADASCATGTARAIDSVWPSASASAPIKGGMLATDRDYKGEPGVATRAEDRVAGKQEAAVSSSATCAAAAAGAWPDAVPQVKPAAPRGTDRAAASAGGDASAGFPYRAELWGGDQAESASLVSLEDFVGMERPGGIELSASQVLRRLDASAWNVIPESDVEALIPALTSGVPTVAASRTIVHLGRCILGEELITELRRARLLLHVPSDGRASMVSLPQTERVSSVRDAFVRGSFLSTYVLACYVLEKQAQTPTEASAGASWPSGWSVDTEPPVGTPSRITPFGLMAPSPFEVTKLVQVLRDWDLAVEAPAAFQGASAGGMTRRAGHGGANGAETIADAAEVD